MRKYNRSDSNKGDVKLNITPILDIVFVLIFALLYSSNFMKIREVAAAIPSFADSSSSQKDDKEDLYIYCSKENYQIRISDKKGKIVHQGKYENIKEEEALIHSLILDLHEKNIIKNRLLVNVNNDVEYTSVISFLDIFKSSEEVRLIFTDIVLSGANK